MTLDRELHAAPWTALALLALASFSTPAQAESARYRLDPVHTRVLFQVGHAGFSSPPGFFTGIEGELQFDEANWIGATLEVRVPVATLQLGDGDWNKRILDGTFLDARRHPQARFVSTAVQQTAPGKGRVTGNLTLHGVTQPVTLEVTLNALKHHPLTKRRTAGFSATATISRKQFGIDAWQAVVDDEVRLVIEAEAVRSGGEGDAAAR